MRELHAIIPGLLPRIEDSHVQAPALAYCLSRATRLEGSTSHPETVLKALFGVQGVRPLPLGALSAQALNLGAGAWLCASPVTLVAGSADVVLQGPVQLSASERAHVQTDLNDTLFAEHAMRVVLNAQGGYVQVPRCPSVVTNSLWDVIGREIGGLLPSGEQAMRWRTLLNETQMVLHGHPVNQARRSAGQPLLSSLWFWGEGPLCKVDTALASVWSDCVAAHGLAQQAKVPAQPWPEGLPSLEAGQHLFFSRVLQQAELAGQWSAWQSALLALEQSFFVPLLAQLRAGTLQRVTLYSGHAVYVLQPRQLWYAWRRVRPFSTFVCAV